MKEYVPGSVKTKQKDGGTQFGMDHMRPADCITYRVQAYYPSVCSVIRHECFICSVIAARGLKVTAVDDAPKGRGGGK